MAMTKLKVGALFLALGVALAGAGAVTINQERTDPAPVAEDNGKTQGTADPVTPPEGTTAEPKVEPPTDPVEKYLRLCERSLSKLDSFVATVQRTSVDRTFQVTEVYEGTAKYLKPNLSMLELHAQGNPKRWQKYVCADKLFYEYDPENKEIRVHEIPLFLSPPGGGRGGVFERLMKAWYSWLQEPVPLPFSSFLQVDKTRCLFDSKLVKEDQWYSYIELQPRAQEAKDDYRRARVVLMKPNYLPRQIWFEQPNGNEVKWDITRIQENVSLPRKEFTAPQVPPGWKLIRLPQRTKTPAPQDVPPPDRPR
jgi:TIGR03009 family protein